MLNTNQSIEMFSNLSNWKTLSQLADENPQFTYAQLKQLFWKRADHAGLTHCVKLIGKRLYINEPAFGLWLAGSLGETGHE